MKEQGTRIVGKNHEAIVRGAEGGMRACHSQVDGDRIQRSNQASGDSAAHAGSMTFRVLDEGTRSTLESGRASTKGRGCRWQPGRKLWVRACLADWPGIRSCRGIHRTKSVRWRRVHRTRNLRWRTVTPLWDGTRKRQE